MWSMSFLSVLDHFVHRGEIEALFARAEVVVLEQADQRQQRQKEADAENPGERDDEGVGSPSRRHEASRQEQNAPGGGGEQADEEEGQECPRGRASSEPRAAADGPQETGPCL